MFLAAMRIGAVPVPVSTMMPRRRPGRAAARLPGPAARRHAPSSPTSPRPRRRRPELRGVLAGGSARWQSGAGAPARPTLTAHATARHDGLPDRRRTRRRSGSTPPAPPARRRARCTGTARSGSSARRTARRCSASARDDRCLSAAKAFFAYGLGNSVLFPLSVGAAAILEPTPSKPDVLAERAQSYGATLFFAGPTFFANMLRAELPDGRAGRRAARRVGAARRCRPRCTSGGPRTSASTSSTASA